MSHDFEHRALDLQENKPLVFTALSKQLFYFRMHIVKFVLEQGAVPLNPFTSFDYFLLDTVPRDLVRTANNNLIKRSDELWVFGPVSNGVLAEIQMCEKMQKPIRYFTVVDSVRIEAVEPARVQFEAEVAQYKDTIFQK